MPGVGGVFEVSLRTKTQNVMVCLRSRKCLHIIPQQVQFMIFRCITGIRHLLLRNISTSVFYFNKLFFSKSRANIARLVIGYTRVIPFTSFSARWTVVMCIKSEAKSLHVHYLGLLRLVWWEDIFTTINPSSTHPNSHNNKKK